MAWQDVLAQDLAAKRLSRAVLRRQTAHAYLFAGLDGVGKKRMALELAGALVCQQPGPDGACGRCVSCHKLAAGNHPDVTLVEPAGSTLKIDQMRAMSRDMHVLPTESTRRVAIIDGVERLGLEAANSVLKLLEEPPAYAVFVLITSNLSAMLPTILSRCQLITFQPLPQPILVQALIERGTPADQAASLALLSAGSLSRAIALASDPSATARQGEVRGLLEKLTSLDEGDLLAVAEAWEKDKDALHEYLDLLVLCLRDAIVWAATSSPQRLLAPEHTTLMSTLSARYGLEGLTAMLLRVEEARRQLKRNANARLVLDVLLLTLADRVHPSQGM